MRLAEKGYQVLVLERGRRYRNEDFPKSNWNIFKYLWLPALRCFGFFQISLLNGVMIAHGGVGGGSLGYANVLEIPTDPMFENPSWHHLANWKQVLRPHYETARYMLGVTRNPRLGLADRLLSDIAKDLGTADSFRATEVGVYFGAEGQPSPDPYFGGEGPARVGCNFCGGCMVGCRYNNEWLTTAATGRFLVPITGPPPSSWTPMVFNDSTWTPATLGIGYYRSNDVEIPPEPGVPLEDLSRPGDLVVPTSSNSPGNEGVANAIDNSSSTKYLNFDKLNAGFTVTLSAGKQVVVGLRLTSANDAPERDPTSYVLSGSNDGMAWTEVARGSIPDFTARFYSVAVSFTNSTAYSQYKLLFPTVRNAASAVAMLIAEVEFLGMAGNTSAGLTNFINTSVEATLYGRSSVYLRVPFVVSDPQ